MKALALLLLLAVPLRASDEEPDQLVEQNCMMCHTQDMLTQQHLTPAQWQKTVTKMQGWGSPLDADDAARVATYLAGRYSPKSPVTGRVMLPLSAVERNVLSAGEAVPGDPGRGEPLYAQACAGCHGADARGGPVAPALYGRPVISRPDAWRDMVQNGRRKMPSFAHLTEAQVFDLLAWVRVASRKSR